MCAVRATVSESFLARLKPLMMSISERSTKTVRRPNFLKTASRNPPWHSRTSYPSSNRRRASSERRLVAGHLNGYVPPEKQRFPVYDIGDELGMDKRRNPVFLFHIRLRMAKTAFDLKGYGK